MTAELTITIVTLGDGHWVAFTLTPSGYRPSMAGDVSDTPLEAIETLLREWVAESE